MAKVAPFAPPVHDVSRRHGGMEGMFTVPDDFDRIFEDEIVQMFDGGE